MSNQETQGDGEKLEYEEISVGINDADSSSELEAITDALKELPGIRALRASQGGAVISYNPLGVTREEICTELERAGFTIDFVEGK